jgi:HlyD family secretion protein
MSAVAPPPVETQRIPSKGMRAWWIIPAVLVCAACLWLGIAKARKTPSGGAGQEIPTAKVARGDVSLSIFSRGEIRGANSEMLAAPMMGGTELHLTMLRRSGEPVKTGDVVVQFDTTDQEFALREAESDKAEAEAHVKQAKAQTLADQEEDHYALQKAEADIKTAELEARKNPLLPSITAKQNDLAVAVARDKLAQLKQNLANRKATDEAGVAMQEAARGKAQSKSETARQNIAAMTLSAKHAGYVAVRQNTAQNFAYEGMELPIFQVGDQVRPGMAVAEIPRSDSWEIGANIGELDRGHLAPGDKVRITVIAIPHHAFRGHLKDIGGTSGMPWDRHFECTIAFDETSDLLRAGMTTRIELETDTLRNALWLPAQALFESDGKTFVYLRSKGGFARRDVSLVRRNETRVVLTGVDAGQEVALVNPTELAKKKTGSKGSALEALPK